jgi:hypothetical protein
VTRINEAQTTTFRGSYMRPLSSAGVSTRFRETDA